MLIVSLPLYVCATASIPIALVLFMKGVSPGAVFVFLMAGPATNASSIAVIGNIMGKKILYLYISLIASTAVFFGIIFDLFFQIDKNIISKHIHHHNHENTFYIILTIFFGVIMANAYISKLKKEVPNMNTSEIPNEDHIESLDFIVNGMTCSHCKESVESAISSQTSSSSSLQPCANTLGMTIFFLNLFVFDFLESQFSRFSDFPIAHDPNSPNIHSKPLVIILMFTHHLDIFIHSFDIILTSF